MFILAQERALFDEANGEERITPKVIKKTAREDMKIIQPMMNALRANDLKAMYKYEDIMINLDDLMINHKKNTEYEGKVKEAMTERQNTLQYRRLEITKNLSYEIASLGIFDTLNPNDIRKLVSKVVDNQPIESEYNNLKLEAIQNAMTLNQKKKEQKLNLTHKDELLPLVKLRAKSLDRKKHPYELFKASGYIKPFLEEFIN
ncbi:hypothetical protein [Lysinibacillus parviboronicapiens]|uniref:hypothetical protein n=1 Tax=Lysinibacillus parviboronicapiens TaxID=436516 RepID=UPI003F69B7EE